MSWCQWFFQIALLVTFISVNIGYIYKEIVPPYWILYATLNYIVYMIWNEIRFWCPFSFLVKTIDQNVPIHLSVFLITGVINEFLCLEIPYLNNLLVIRMGLLWIGECIYQNRFIYQ